MSKKIIIGFIIGAILLGGILLVVVLKEVETEEVNLNPLGSDPEKTKNVKESTPESSAFPKGIFRTDQCIYMTPISSTFSGPNNGLTYVFDEDVFSILRPDEKGEMLQTNTVLMNHMIQQKRSFTDEEWEGMFFSNVLMPDISQTKIEDRGMYILSDRYRLFVIEDKLWIGDISSKGEIWSIYHLKSVEMDEDIELENTSIQWSFLPAVSCVFAALPIRVDQSVGELHATVTSGTLYLHDDSKTPNYIDCGRKYAYKGEEVLLWVPFKDNVENTVEKCELRFSIEANDGRNYGGTFEIKKVNDPLMASVISNDTYRVSLIESDGPLKFGASDEIGGGGILILK